MPPMYDGPEVFWANVVGLAVLASPIVLLGAVIFSLIRHFYVHG